MNVYVYHAALLCEKCGKAVLDDMAHNGVADTGDSGTYPQGPYSDGGGEADCPQHCDHCRDHLENPLTDDGRDYVRERLACNADRPDVLNVWRAFYGDTL